MLREHWGMKTSTNIFSRLILVASVGAFAAGSSIKAQEIITNSSRANSGAPARLIVNRGANFGVNESIDLRVDGKTVAVLGYNESYNATLSAGKHVLAIGTNPETYLKQAPKPIRLTAESGKTYTFTAVWPDPEGAGLVAN
jgi:hypothetical protein